MKRLLLLLPGLALLCGPTSRADLTARFTAATAIPVSANGYAASGVFTAALDFAPATGTNLTVVRNMGPAFISGQFTNLAQGQVVTLPYAGINYRFIANYYGGSGNDLVLHWAPVKAIGWGFNQNGQLGSNTRTAPRAVPSNVFSTGVLAGKTVLSQATGHRHSLALCSDGTVASWGHYDQLAHPLPKYHTESPVPVLVDRTGVLSGKTVVSLAAGSNYSLALCSDGTLAAWGHNPWSQLGDGSTQSRDTPVAVDTTGGLRGKTVTAIAVGSSHNLALCSDGTVVSWGHNGSGQLGINSTEFPTVPGAVNTSGALAGKTVVAIAAGQAHSLALCSDGTLVSWGRTVGLVGSASTASVVPVKLDPGVLSGKTVVAIAAGAHHNLALCSDGTVAAWGRNPEGQLGNNSTTNSAVPVAVDTSGVLAGKTVVAIAAGEDHSLAGCSDGTLVAWGENDSCQLSIDGVLQSTVPVAVSNAFLTNGERYAACFTGPASIHSLALVALPPTESASTPEPAK